ncbi:hypothetical protein EVAR_30855_1 [Eumeta japonica]|uniref:Uncharacterized protein n=1 Tax=Eumeta variegata TaxID=151549 RepID=A0A4C1XUF0_EUMVA|nr:hypothetical protein EVAR_30855_1 [Eumeta japonica]
MCTIEARASPATPAPPLGNHFIYPTSARNGSESRRCAVISYLNYLNFKFKREQFNLNVRTLEKQFVRAKSNLACRTLRRAHCGGAHGPSRDAGDDGCRLRPAQDSGPESPTYAPLPWSIC